MAASRFDSAIRALRLAVILHLLAWAIVFSTAALSLYLVTLVLWVLVPVVVGIAVIGLTRSSGWTFCRALLLGLAAANAICFTRVTLLPMTDATGEPWLPMNYAFVITATLLPIVTMIELFLTDKPQPARQAAPPPEDPEPSAPASREPERETVLTSSQ